MITFRIWPKLGQTILLAVILSSGFVHATSASTRIINGIEADIGDHDYYVLILQRVYSLKAISTSYLVPICGGSYVGDGLIVTAAQCFGEDIEDSELYVLLNFNSEQFAYINCDLNTLYVDETECSITYDIDDEKNTGVITYTGDELGLIELTDSNVVLHPAWDTEEFLNGYDIALIDLPVEALIEKSSLSLPLTDRFHELVQSQTSNSIVAIGYGDILSDDDFYTILQSTKLLQVELTPLSDAECEGFLGSFNSGTIICAGDLNEDTCRGDAGGPLFENGTDVLLGITSFGPSQCGDPDHPFGAYTNVYQFVDWIESRGLASDLVESSSSAGSLDFILLPVLLGLRLWRRN